MSIGDRIKEIRGNTSRDVFSADLGVNRNTVQNYEIYGRGPSFEFITAVCERYNIHADWLIFGKEPKFQGDAQKEKTEKLNRELLLDTVVAIEKVLQDTDREMTSEAKAELIIKVYELFVEDDQKPNKEKLFNVLKLAV